MGILDVIL